MMPRYLNQGNQKAVNVVNAFAKYVFSLNKCQRQYRPGRR